MATSIERKGSCLCGKIQIRITGEPVMKVVCHCFSCQKASGTIFQANAMFATKDVHFSDPDNVIQKYKDTSSDSGSVLERSFCGRCGSTVSNHKLFDPATEFLVAVPIGVLDGDRADLKPAVEFFTKRRAEWCPKIEGCAEREAM